MADGHHPHVLSIPAGVPFLKTLAARLCDGRLSDRYRLDLTDPLSLSRVTIYVPTRRAARVLRSEFVDILGGRSAILPVIRPLGETDDDSGFFDIAAPTVMDLAQPLSSTARLLELGRLILAWRNQLPKLILDIHTDSPLVAPASPADAIWLARSLAELIDAIETEERDWEDLQALDTGAHALWWQLTTEFLKIASAFWPARLAELGQSSSARHRNAMLRAEAQRLKTLADTGPVIVAGSTGSVPAAAELIAAVASLPQGIIVLPGLDLAMQDHDWSLVGGGDAGSIWPDPATRTHPQYGLFQLLKRLELTRTDVRALAEADGDLALRASAISQALTPARATDGWTAWRDSIEPEALQSAFCDVALIESANEREEATAIAIALRLALEKPGAHGQSQAALITPDRNLARRVTAELARFGIQADDSAGTPLSATHQGTLLILLLEAALRPGDPVAIIALLKHPLPRFGMTKAAFDNAVSALERLALRGGVHAVEISELASLLDIRLAEQSKDRHPPLWRKHLDDGSAELAAELALRIAAAVEPLTGAIVRQRPDGRKVTEKLTLSDWAARAGRALEAICVDEDSNLAALWSGEAGERLASLLGEVIETDGQMEADGAQWIDIVAALLAGEAVKPRALSHPRLFIFGTLEARLQHVDTLVLGGLNEGSWPGQTANNPFLSRMMMTGIGLEPPERRIGQLAHDFEMANGIRNLIYSRSVRQGSTPTVASRWLQRLLALGGKQFAEALKTRGAQYRHWATLVDAGERQEPTERPAPKPPADLQPRSYSFSEVGRLRRDPYSIYARRVLRLDPVDPFNRDPGASERGTLYHKIIERYTSENHLPGTPDSLAAMRRLTDELFDAEKLPIHIDLVWRSRFHEVARAFLDWEKQRRPEIRRTLTEVRADMPLEAVGIKLTGMADRIDIKGDRSADIIDYKTGSNPSPSQARALLDPQLALEAAALHAGAFKDTLPLASENLLYVRLRPGDRFGVDQVNNELSARDKAKAKSAMDLADESIDQLTKFVLLLQSGEQGFVSRLMPAQQNEYGGDYDHLARVAEWSTAETEEVANDE
jgi:ATP-dependent helicase/nuclease subunit B